MRAVWLRVPIVVGLLALAAMACSLGSNSERSTVDPDTIPLVLLLAPVNNSVFAEGAEVELHALAQDVRGRAAALEFRVDDVPVARIDAPSLQGQETLTARATWTAAGQSKHVMTAEVFRADGLSLGLVDIVITVVAPPAARVLENEPASPDDAAGVNPTSTPGAQTQPQTDLGILSGPTAVVSVAELNVRQGPDTRYPSVGTLQRGDRIEIIGRNADGSWWAIAYRGGSAWVFAELVTPEGDISGVPLVASP